MEVKNHACLQHRSDLVAKLNRHRHREFDQIPRHAVQAVQLIGGVAIVLYDPDGQQVINSRLELDAALPKRIEFDVERRAIETGLPQVSGLQKAVVDGQPIVTIAVPVRIEGKIRYALNIGLSTKYLSGLMDEYISSDLVGSIVDGKGFLLARRPLLDGEELVGKPTIPEVMPPAIRLRSMTMTDLPRWESS